MTEFDQKKAITDIIAGLVTVRQANTKIHQQAEAELAKWEAARDACLVLEAYIKEQLAQLVARKRQIEEAEKNG
jgi:FixJ family two-component response regulator